MNTVLKIVSVASGQEVARATLTGTGHLAYTGSDVAKDVLRTWLLDHPGKTEADAVRALAREGWSNGYLMVELPQRR